MFRLVPSNLIIDSPVVDKNYAGRRAFDISGTGYEEFDYGETANCSHVSYSADITIQRVLIASPDAFVNPRVWNRYSNILETILSEHAEKYSSPTSQQNLHALDQSLADTFANIRHRNNALLFHDVPASAQGSLSSALSDIKVCMYLL